jgi:hypothetical protein
VLLIQPIGSSKTAAPDAVFPIERGIFGVSRERKQVGVERGVTALPSKVAPYKVFTRSRAVLVPPPEASQSRRVLRL